MNAHTHITTPGDAASFPVAYPGQQPGDDLHAALSLLHVAREALSTSDGASREYAAQLSAVISVAIDQLEPIGLLLDHRGSGDLRDAYLQSRREWTRQKGAVS